MHPSNNISLGNGLYAQIQLCDYLESYHVTAKDLKLQIESGTVTWFIPANVFNNQDHIKIQIKLYSQYDCLLCLKKNGIFNEDDELKLIIDRRSVCLRSWGNDGGDFCIINPDSNVSCMLYEVLRNDISSLILTTYGAKDRGGYTVSDGHAHFATYGKSSQRFGRACFEEDVTTAVTTVFDFNVVK